MVRSHESWIINADLVDANAIDAYICAMYFSLVTVITLGYGDINAITEGEKIFTILILIVACGFFSYILGSV